jgi:hypothetical protein
MKSGGDRLSLRACKWFHSPGVDRHRQLALCVLVGLGCALVWSGLVCFGFLRSYVCFDSCWHCVCGVCVCVNVCVCLSFCLSPPPKKTPFNPPLSLSLSHTHTHTYTHTNTPDTIQTLQTHKCFTHTITAFAPPCGTSECGGASLPPPLRRPPPPHWRKGWSRRFTTPTAHGTRGGGCGE